MSQNCSGKQTLSLESFGGDKDGRPKPTWSIALNGRSPLSADTITSALSADGRSIVAFDNTGRVGSTVQLQAAARTVTPPQALGVQDDQIELISLSGRLVAVGRSSNDLLWSRPDSGIPVEDGTTVLLPQPGQIAVISPATGSAERSVAVADATASAQVVRIGSGVLLAGTHTAVYTGS